jgi:hypothetical protein
MNDYLQQKFPDMGPISGPPSLTTINGIGMTVYGSRDYDTETGTYVKTLCFCVLFIPLFFVRAYRVADAPSGWYFIGQVPLSRLAKWWNLALPLIVAMAVGIGLWIGHINSAAYLAQRRLAEGDRLAAEGQLAAAAEVYRQVAAARGTPAAGEARERLSNLIDQVIPPVNAEEAAGVFRAALELNKIGMPVRELFERGKTLAEKHGAGDPRGGLNLLALITPLAPDPQALVAVRFALLQRAVAKEPGDLDLCSDLAVVHESRKEFDQCEKLLAPHAKQLGDREGARILGQIYAKKGKRDEAYALLAPYAEQRLKRLEEAERALADADRRIGEEIIQELRRGTAAGFDYPRYDAADKATKAAMVNEYILGRLKDHPDMKGALEALRRENNVVGVALDLGMIHLQRGQGLPDPGERRKELEKAEQMFLAVRNAAGKSDHFQLNLGQVYYWLGKQNEGRKLFDDYLTTQGRSSIALFSVAGILREVGATSEAKALAEEAYDKEPDSKRKQMIARLRSVLAVELEDLILWLTRGDPDDPDTKASLARARAQEALLAGRDEEAAEQCRQAIAMYDGMPESSVTLNNSALCYLTLYAATGDPEAQKSAVARLERALALRGQDSILLSNTADQILAQAVADVIGPRIDLKLLRESGNLRMLDFLCNDPAGREQLIEQLRGHAGVTRGREYFERLLLLAPRRARAYITLASLYAYLRDVDGLRGLSRRLEDTKLDLEESERLALEHFQGKSDDKLSRDLGSSLVHLERELKEARKVGGPTLGVSVMDRFAAKVVLWRLGEPAKPDELVAIAEQAYKAAPSFGTRGVLVSSLLERAHHDLVSSEPTYATLAKKCQRSLNSRDCIAVVLSRDGPAHKACLTHPDVKRVLQILREEFERAPQRGNEWTWAMFRLADPGLAAKVAESCRKDEVAALQRSILVQVSPYSADHVYRHAWALEMADDLEQARAVLRRAAARGVPLPFDEKD